MIIFMANVQKENGYISIATELLEALYKRNISPDLQSILFAIMRLTWGWHQKADYIKTTTLSEMTGIRSNHVSRALKKLSALKMIERDANGFTTLQKDYDKWDVPVRVLNDVPKLVLNDVPKLVHKVPIQVHNDVPKLVKKDTYTGTIDVPKQVSHYINIVKDIKHTAKELLSEEVTFPLKGDFVDNVAWVDDALIGMDALRIQFPSKENQAAYYFVRFWTSHRSKEVYKLFRESDRLKVWKIQRPLWLKVAENDLQDDFTSSVMMKAFLNDVTIQNPLEYLKACKPTFEAYEI